MNITEEPLSEFELSEIEREADEALNLLGRDLAKADPATVVRAIDDYAYRWQKVDADEIDDDDDERLASILRSLWGQQLVKQFGWQWAKVICHNQDSSSAVGVFSPDRSLAVFPFTFLLECIESPSTDLTVMLSFNTLLAGRISNTQPQNYENLMEGVHRIVPRD